MMKRRESFIVYLVVDDTPGRGTIVGNIEHIRSGWTGSFSSQEELAKILVQALEDIRAGRTLRKTLS